MTDNQATELGYCVKLREHIEGLVRHERELRESAFRAQSQALRLGAEEYARRLEILNGEAARLHNMQLTYLPRETFALHVEAQDRWRINVDKAIIEARAGARTIAIAASVIVTLITVALRFWGK